MTDHSGWPYHAPRGVVETLIEACSQILSVLTFGWWNPWRSPVAFSFLSTSARAGRGADLGHPLWVLVAPVIDRAFEHRWLDKRDGHCRRSWAGYRAHRGVGADRHTGAMLLTLLAQGAVVAVVWVLVV